MADRVDATVDGVKPAAFDPVTDRMPAEPGANELCSGDHAMLPLGETGNEPIRLKTVDYCTHNRLKCSLVRGVHLWDKPTWRMDAPVPRDLARLES